MIKEQQFEPYSHFINVKSKAVPLHAMKALGGEGV
jgi:hypothetical protein